MTTANDSTTSVVLQTERNGFMACMCDTWDEQKSCSLAQKSTTRNQCMYYDEDLDHCWLPKYQK